LRTFQDPWEPCKLNHWEKLWCHCCCNTNSPASKPRIRCWKCSWNARTSGTPLEQLTGGIL